MSSHSLPGLRLRRVRRHPVGLRVLVCRHLPLLRLLLHGQPQVALPTPPHRHWRSYGNDPPPTPAEAMLEPTRAFPSWYLRIECDRCGKVVMRSGFC